MKAFKIMAVLLAACMFTGCSGNTVSQSSSQPESHTQSEHTEHEDSYYIKWAIPDSIGISDKTLYELNDKLEEKYDIGVRFITLSDTAEGADYQDELRKTDADIAFLGFDDEGTKPCEQLISEGLFEPLDEYLKGSELYDAIPSQLWECSVYNGSTYVIPNETVQDIGVNIVFDLDRIDKEKAVSFNGDITKLPEILGDEGVLGYGISGFDFMSYFGLYYADGRLYSADGSQQDPLENEDALNWLKTVNSLFLSGRATDDINAQWSVCITRDTTPISKKNIYAYKTKCTIGPRFSATTGILKNSSNKERSFKLLQAVRLDTEIGDLLVYGSEAEIKDGQAFDENGEQIDGYVTRLVFGTNTGLLKNGAMLMSFDSFEERKKYYDENVIAFPSAGIMTEADDRAVIFNGLSEIYKSKDIDNDLQDVREKLHKAGA